MATKQNIVASFPALKKLGFHQKGKSVPFVQQLEWTDCGAASLCMVMAFHGRESKLAEVFGGTLGHHLTPLESSAQYFSYDPLV